MTAQNASPTMSLPAAGSEAAPLCSLGGHVCDQHLVDYWLAVSAEVSRIQRHIDRKVEQSGIAAQYGAALHLLLRAEDYRAPMTTLAREMSMTSGGFSKLADRMVTAGLIARRGSAGDRRIVLAMLTAHGLAAAQQTAGTYREALRTYLRNGVAAEADSGAGECSCDVSMRRYDLAWPHKLPLCRGERGTG